MRVGWQINVAGIPFGNGIFICCAFVNFYIVFTSVLYIYIYTQKELFKIYAITVNINRRFNRFVIDPGSSIFVENIRVSFSYDFY